MGEICSNFFERTPQKETSSSDRDAPLRDAGEVGFRKCRRVAANWLGVGGKCISVAPSARPHFGFKMRFRFLAVCIRQSSTAFRAEP
ncbi:hypothetical protein COX76_00815 [Candidatus Kaiserbacteria bacterium CG_4_10_14_0_2_um_filter_50_16]|nr:MAG: hypothetical protein COX76_00815 [Candidatus Kaiserbacteria bacterium CG_4_10_14_0_2_um_filter_50_16]